MLANLEIAETTWHIPALVGVIAGGFLTSWFMERGPRARAMQMNGLSGYRRRGTRGRRCVRYKRTRAGRRCAKYSR